MQLGNAADWYRLLSDARSFDDVQMVSDDPTRNEFERDFDRITFSSPFRRMQDKTQVFPLSNNDFTRTRLTHSLEVSCVGRSLGRILTTQLRNHKHNLPISADIGAAVAAACLAHDIGNPPFGHSGEDAIQTWAKKNIGYTKSGMKIELSCKSKIADLYHFEGNAQGLRILTRLMDGRKDGGAKLAFATLGAVAKYPVAVISVNLVFSPFPASGKFWRWMPRSNSRTMCGRGGSASIG
jgi:dGTPase